MFWKIIIFSYIVVTVVLTSPRQHLDAPSSQNPDKILITDHEDLDLSGINILDTSSELLRMYYSLLFKNTFCFWCMRILFACVYWQKFMILYIKALKQKFFLGLGFFWFKALLYIYIVNILYNVDLCTLFKFAMHDIIHIINALI